MDNAYSYLKPLRQLDVIQGVKAGNPVKVPHVQLVLADLCNQSCHFCAYRLEGYTSNQNFNDKNMMPQAKALEIIEDCAEIGVKAIEFTGGGEPTVHKFFQEAIKRTHELGMRFSLVSNGTRMTPELAEHVVRASWVRISIDASTEATYTKVRRVHKGHWTAAQNAIRLLREARDRLKTDCVIGMGFVVTPDNWREVEDAAWMALHLGADNIRISAQFSSEDEKLFLPFYSEASELCKKAEQVACNGFTVYNRFGDRLEDLQAKNPEDELCGYQFFNTYIGADLQVYRCCGYAYNERGWIGDLRKLRFKDFWMSRERFARQMDFDARGCERCLYRRQNQALAYVMAPGRQMHEEFV